MQTITVKDIRVKTGITKSGQNEGKPWELVIIIGQDGSEFTTFDTAVKDVGIGGVLEAEVEVKNGKTNIKSFRILTKGTASAPVAAGPAPQANGFPDMSKEDWAEKQRIERASFEAQTAFKGLMEVAGQIISGGGDPVQTASPLFNENYTLAMAWAKGKILNNGIPGPDLASLPVPRPDSVPPTARPLTPEEEAKLLFPDFKDIGQLFTACLKINVSRVEALKRIGAKEGDNLANINLADAWSVITKNGATA